MTRIFVLLAAAVSLFGMEPLVGGSWLLKQLEEKQLVIVDVSDKAAYELGHIPGAIWSGIERWRQPKGGAAAEVQSAEALQKEMRRLGIGKESAVVVYSHHLDGKDMLKATYVLWAMAYAGFENTALLDGGLNAYTAAGGTLSQVAEADRRGDYTVAVRPEMVATMDEVKAALHKVPMVDSRPAVFYFGADLQAVLKRPGHISGAKSYFWRYSVTNENRLKPSDELSVMIEAGLDLDKTKPLIIYCTGGLEASMNDFVFRRVLGFQKAKLYDASMKEWANRDDTPMTTFRWE